MASPVGSNSISSSPRCNFGECNKKLTLVQTTIKCLCHKTFCNLHRQAEYHGCKSLDKLGTQHVGTASQIKVNHWVFGHGTGGGVH